MTKRKIFTVFYYVFAVMLFSFCVFGFFAPFPQQIGAARSDGYECVWQNGVTTRENYFSACSCLRGLNDGYILLERDALTGRIASPEAADAETVLRGGSLAQLLSLDCEGADPLARAALVSTFANVLYYSEYDYFSFNGTGVERTKRTETEILSLLSGTVPPTVIRKSLAKEVWVSPDTEITATALIDTRVECIVAQEPYLVYEDGLYLNTAGGRRLIAALPGVRTLSLSGNDFADEGALLACRYLEEITLSFAGSAKSGIGSRYRGEFAHLFSRRNQEYAVPPTLKKVAVTGGKLITHAFYACGGVEEISACGMNAEDIDEYAFVDCSSLRVLHVPKADVVLPFDEFVYSTAPCGCTVYQRREI